MSPRSIAFVSTTSTRFLGATPWPRLGSTAYTSYSCVPGGKPGDGEATLGITHDHYAVHLKSSPAEMAGNTASTTLA